MTNYENPLSILRRLGIDSRTCIASLAMPMGAAEISRGATGRANRALNFVIGVSLYMFLLSRYVRMRPWMPPVVTQWVAPPFEALFALTALLGFLMRTLPYREQLLQLPMTWTARKHNP
ncbi:MAG: hypothetical protein AAF355_04250 [Myxococcota bacterium]